jgi:2,5-diamino-6-(ribosylamino)-4(3H)-pyrimidinone 5'-phosphate reductase
MKPYIICHSMGSVDGRIQATNWDIKKASEYFEKPASKIKADAWIVGRTTMQEFSSKKPYLKRKGTFRIPKTDFIGEHKSKTYAVAIDPSGKCHFDSNMVSTEHVIQVLTEKVSGEYLDQLQRKQVSYIFAGKTEIDLAKAMKKLRKLFGIKVARIDGGGGVNGSFLKAGLIDELSLVLMPIADGAMEVPTVFDAERGHTKRRATHLKLKSVKHLKNGSLWIRYKVQP